MCNISKIPGEWNFTDEFKFLLSNYWLINCLATFSLIQYHLTPPRFWQMSHLMPAAMQLDDVLSMIMQQQTYDYLGLKANPLLQTFISKKKKSTDGTSSATRLVVYMVRTLCLHPYFAPLSFPCVLGCHRLNQSRMRRYFSLMKW